MELIDPRLEQQKRYPRAMQSYVLMLYEFVYELKPSKMLEIGVQNGQSTKTILMALEKAKAGKLVSIDHKRRETILDAEYSDLKPRWHFIRGNSHDQVTIDAAKAQLADGELYDMLFIDGDHKMPGIQLDWENFFPMVKPGGLIMLHDITNKNEDVWQLWERIGLDKFGIDWGRAANSVIPGFGIVRKPNESKK